MKSNVLILLILISLTSCAQKTDCYRFKDGTFFVTLDSLPNSHYFYVFRNATRQVEVDKNNIETYLSVNWLSDCSYEVRLLPEVNEGKNLKILTDSSIIRIEIFKTKKDTAWFNSSSIIDKRVNSFNGKMIRVGEVPPE